jgi:LmbE family N-acetylglucosaminyl deacetylase
MSEDWPVPDAPVAAPRLTAPMRGRVLVLAPHPDDESIGCGGVLALHARQGDPVLVAVLSDGARGDPAGFYRGVDYVGLRQAQTRAGLGCLGLTDVEFLSLPDAHLSEVAGLPDALGERIGRFRPDVIYAPSPWETHPDHWAAAHALQRALKKLEVRPAWWAYEVWTPVLATHLVDIGPVWAQKQSAIACHASELRYVDYRPHVEGLARYRTLHAAGVERAEAFRVMARLS